MPLCKCHALDTKNKSKHHRELECSRVLRLRAAKADWCLADKTSRGFTTRLLQFGAMDESTHHLVEFHMSVLFSMVRSRSTAPGRQH